MAAIPGDDGDSGDPRAGVTFVIKFSEFGKNSAPSQVGVNLCYGCPGECRLDSESGARFQRAFVRRSAYAAGAAGLHLLAANRSRHLRPLGPAPDLWRARRT